MITYSLILTQKEKKEKDYLSKRMKLKKEIFTKHENNKTLYINDDWYVTNKKVNFHLHINTVLHRLKIKCSYKSNYFVLYFLVF